MRSEPLTFACPDCGVEVGVPAQTAPGRQCRCPGCGAVVEVPFFPRQRIQRGGRRPWREKRRRRWIVLGVGGAGVLVVLVAVLVVWQGMQRAGHEARVRKVEGEVERLEGVGDVAGAIAALDEAIRLTGRGAGGGTGSAGVGERVEGYRRRRLELVQREFEGAFGQVKGLPAEEGLALLSRLQSRIKLEEGLAKYRVEVSAAERAQRVRVVEEGLAAVAQDLAAGDDARVLGRSEELMRVLEGEAGVEAGSLRDRLRSQVERAVRRSGLVVELGQPEFLTSHGERGWYMREVVPACEAVARERGYLTGSEIAEFQALWSGEGAYRMRVEVREDYGSFYEQSANRTARVDLTVLLERGDRVVWQTRFQAKTRIPPPGLGNRAAGNLGAAEKASPEFEKLLHDDARKVLMEMLGGRLRGMPPRERAARSQT